MKPVNWLGRAPTGLQLAGVVTRAGLAVFLFVPVVAIVVLSFSADELLVFPPGQWGFDRYEAFFGSETWVTAVWESLKIGVAAASLALVAGLSLVLAIYRTNLPFKDVLQAVGIGPLVLPRVAYAVALYTFFIQIDLIGKGVGLMLAHAALGIPFVILIVGPAIGRIPVDLEFVAMSLGASRARAIVGVTLRLLLPSIAGAYILAFVVSFDDAIFAVFLSGPEFTTLPKAIYNTVKTGLEPLITAIATLLMVATGIVLSAATFLRRVR